MGSDALDHFRIERFRRRHIGPRRLPWRRQCGDHALAIAAFARTGAADDESEFWHARHYAYGSVSSPVSQIDRAANRNLSLLDRRSLASRAKRECGEATLKVLPSPQLPPQL